MKLYVKILLLLQLFNHFAHAYIPIICSNNGGICKIEDINQFAIKFMDRASNYVYRGYLVYCKYVCSFIQYVFGTWTNFTKERSKTTVWYEQLWEDYFTPIMKWIGLEPKKDEYVEEMVCKSSAPLLAIAFSFGFYALTVYLRRKPKHIPSITKLDVSAYSQDPDDDEIRSTSTYSTLINTYDQRSCCGCKVSISDVSEKSESL